MEEYSRPSLVAWTLANKPNWNKGGIPKQTGLTYFYQTAHGFHLFLDFRGPPVSTPASTNSLASLNPKFNKARTSLTSWTLRGANHFLLHEGGQALSAP